MLPVRCEARIKKPNENYVVSKESLLYLEVFLCDNGSIGPELNRRLGAARAEFETLCRVWNHAVPPKAGKIRIFEARVLSKLLYCLHTTTRWAKTTRTSKTVLGEQIGDVLSLPWIGSWGGGSTKL